MSEEAAQQAIRLARARAGCLDWRNNSGVAQYADGRPVRFGLANDSAQLNARIKSSDLIGITPLVIRPEHVGYLLGVFTAIETKRPGWHLTPGDARGQAQKAYHDLVRGVGGFAGFATSVDDLKLIIPT